MRTIRSPRSIVIAAIGVVSLMITPTWSTAAPSPTGSIVVSHAPTPPAGANDEYRCTWFDPRFTTNQMVTKTEFRPDTSAKKTSVKELHHAIAYIAQPSVVASIKALDPTGTKGWSCFASPLGPTSMAGLGALPWLAGWSPGHGADVQESGYGVLVPAGSLIVLQIHYNSLAGKKKVTSAFDYYSENQSGSTRVPLRNSQMAAPPTMPCVPPYDNVSKYPLCNYTKSLADLSKRFGSASASFTQLLEYLCNRSPRPLKSTDANARSAQCLYGPQGATWTVHSVTPHMHMLGKTFTLVLCRQDATCAPSHQETLLVVSNYNFDNQFGYPLSSPVVVNPGDYFKVSCTFDPTLRKLNPQTKNLAPRYITWGDGSSDEMCLGTIQYTVGAGT